MAVEAHFYPNQTNNNDTDNDGVYTYMVWNQN